MNYRVEFSYIGSDGSREYEEDTIYRSNRYKAIEAIEYYYDTGDLKDFRIERIWIDRGNRWEDITPDWL